MLRILILVRRYIGPRDSRSTCMEHVAQIMISLYITYNYMILAVACSDITGYRSAVHVLRKGLNFAYPV